MEERFYWLGFSVISGVGPVKFRTLIKRFGSAKEAWWASLTDLQDVLGEKTTEKFDNFRKKFSIEAYTKKLKAKDVSFLILEDVEYPKLLKEIKNPPFVLYVRGTFDFNVAKHLNMISVVGTRKITNYGRDVTTLLTQDLATAGFCVISGLALGVDAAAHEAALKSGGKTIAVLGCGVNCCTPSENQALYNSIVNGGGCVISELPLDHPPTKGSFPSRNRIIAGLSLGVLVTEGAEDSGALITADYAFKNNRPVFAVPGPITSSFSKGPHKLLSKGAKLVTSAKDIIDELGIKNYESRVQKRKITTESKEEEKILKILEAGEIHIDEIVRRSGFETAKVGSLLSVMEMKGMVRDSGGGTFKVSS